MNRFINRLMYRAWVLVENMKEIKYVMIYFGEMGTKEFRDFPLNSPDVKDIMQTTCWTDVRDRTIYEKDILEYEGKRCTLFFNIHKGEYQILHMEGSFEKFDAEKAKFSRVIGNIYESPYKLVKRKS